MNDLEKRIAHLEKDLALSIRLIELDVEALNGKLATLRSQQSELGALRIEMRPETRKEVGEVPYYDGVPF